MISIIKQCNFIIETPAKVLLASTEMKSQGHADIDFYIETKLHPKFEFTNSTEDFIQFVDIKQWVKNTYAYDNVSPTKLTDALHNYVKRYPQKESGKNKNKYLQCVKWITQEM